MDTIKQDVNIQLTREYLILSPLHRPYKYCLIFLHGIGMSVQKFFSVFLSSSIVELLKDFKIYVPQAPIGPMDFYDGALGPSWNRRSEESFKAAGEKIKQLYQKELEGVDNNPKRMFLGGFSQGSILGLDVGLSLEHKIGGIIVIGGMMSEYTKFNAENEHSDILVIHGEKDKIIPWEKYGETFNRILGRSNVKLVKIEDMEHDLYSEEAKKIVHDFIRDRSPTI